MKSNEARQALDAVESMEQAGWRRAAPPHWFGVGMALLIGAMYASYAFEKANDFIVWWAVALVILLGYAQNKMNARGRDFPPPKGRRLYYFGVVACMLLMFFASIVLRQWFDAPWISIVAGLLAGLCVYSIYEYERRRCLGLSGRGRVE